MKKKYISPTTEENHSVALNSELLLHSLNRPEVKNHNEMTDDEELESELIENKKNEYSLW